MRLDSSAIPSGTTLDADVAIVGAGPAGIVIALELANSGHRVALIESGGPARDSTVQRLGDLAGDDPHHVAMDLATSRQLGGASNLWGGRCVPFDPIDFEERAVVDAPPWPVSYDEIAAYLPAACEWCVCGDARFDAGEVAGLSAKSLVPGFPNGRVRASALERWSLPTNFAHEYASQLASHPLITLVSNLTCTAVVTEAHPKRVRCLEAQTLDGKSVTVLATRYVLACGGLETTRLLFASNATEPAGLGNHSGHLGRWYMAHVESRIARVHFDTDPRETIYGYERDVSGVYVRRRFTFSRAFLRDQRLANTAIWLVNPTMANPSHGSAILSLVYLMLISPFGRLFVAEGIRQAHIATDGPASRRAHVRNVLCGLFPATRFAVGFGYRRFVKGGRKVPGFFIPSADNVYPLLYHAEHLPQRNSYVTPSHETDALGMARLHTHLRFGDDDIANVLRAHQCLDEYLREHHIGHLEYLYENLEDAVREQLFGGYHQAGTTRMSTRPEDGVVDQNLAVHGYDDLFVASSSTFVTSGQANSTLMIIAFAVRLSEHMRRSSAPVDGAQTS